MIKTHTYKGSTTKNPGPIAQKIGSGYDLNVEIYLFEF